jgi:hypothetical protein
MGMLTKKCFWLLGFVVMYYAADVLCVSVTDVYRRQVVGGCVRRCRGVVCWHLGLLANVHVVSTRSASWATAELAAVQDGSQHVAEHS